MMRTMLHKRLVFIDPNKELSFRNSLRVTEYIVIKGHDLYPLCPRCQISLEREYMQFCNNCGQKLSWNKFSKAKERKIPLRSI